MHVDGLQGCLVMGLSANSGLWVYLICQFALRIILFYNLIVLSLRARNDSFWFTQLGSAISMCVGTFHHLFSGHGYFLPPQHPPLAAAAFPLPVLPLLLHVQGPVLMRLETVSRFVHIVAVPDLHSFLPLRNVCHVDAHVRVSIHREGAASTSWPL